MQRAQRSLTRNEPQPHENWAIKTRVPLDQFKKNTPGSSHMGGVWEQQMRSVHAVLFSVPWSNPVRLKDESLRAFTCEAESRINSHHSTVDQLTDPDSPEPFMPNHLLTMKSRISLLPRLVGTHVPYMHGNLLWLVSCSPGFTKCLPINVKLQLCRIYVVNAKGNSYYLLYFALHMN